MSRQYFSPTGPLPKYVNETGRRQYQIAGGAYINETIATSGTWKTSNGLALASIKTVNGLAKASIKTNQGLTP